MRGGRSIESGRSLIYSIEGAVVVYCIEAGFAHWLPGEWTYVFFETFVE